MSFFQNHAGFNITDSKLQLVEVCYKDDNILLENVDEEYFDEFLDLSAKETKLISILQNAYNEIALRKPILSSTVSFTLPQSFFKIVELPIDDTLTKDDFIDHLKWEASVLYPEYQPQDFVIQHIPLEDGLLHEHKSVILIAVIKRYLKILHKFCLRNNLKLGYVDNVHIASNMFVQIESTALGADKAVSLYIGEKAFSLILLNNNMPVHHSVRVLKSPSDILDLITEDLERLKNLGYGTDEINQIYAAGENISDNLMQQVKERLGITIIKYNPFGKLTPSSHVSENDYYTDYYNTFTAPAGIAIRQI